MSSDYVGSDMFDNCINFILT